jgi:hypothetical protein
MMALATTRRMIAAFAVAAALLVGLLASPTADAAPKGSARRCAGVSSATGTDVDARKISVKRLQNCLRINQIQVLGSHNSYRQPTTPEILAALKNFDQEQAEALEYSHSPLAEQFGGEGIRQIELDVFADPDGGLYARRVTLDALGLSNNPPAELNKPGFKTLHIQDLDFETHCLTLVACLEQISEWSNRFPRHLPIAILIELKDESIPDPLDLGFTVPHPIRRVELDALDAEIRSVFAAQDMIVPDDVRDKRRTLRAAVRRGAKTGKGGWPTLAKSRGKVLFLMDNGGSYRRDYLKRHPSLAGRVMFTNADPGAADAAFVKVNDPVGNVAYIQSLVAKGYVVRTRSDTPTDQARSGDTTRLVAALASGAQWISTDYPVAGRSIWSDYVAGIPGGRPARCNPLNTGPRCRNAKLERLG